MTENENINMGEDKKIFSTWVESYTTISKMWNDYYLQIYKPWFDVTGDLLEKAVQLSKNPSADKYKEFYDEWLKVHVSNKTKFQVSDIKSNKDLLEKILSDAEESTKMYKSWNAEFEDNSKKTEDLLKEENVDIAKYKEIYEIWADSYDKTFEGFLTLPLKNMKIFESRSGLPDIYTDSYVQISKTWHESYIKFYRPWMESVIKLSEKSSEISKGKSDVDNYKEFYNLWLDVYRQTFGDIFDAGSMETKKSIENFVIGNINLYNSWIAAIKKLSQKVSKENETTEMGVEYLKLWIKTYEKFFESIFENIPTVGPFGDVLEPIKIATKTYLESFSRMIDIWSMFYSIPSKPKDEYKK